MTRSAAGSSLSSICYSEVLLSARAGILRSAWNRSAWDTLCSQSHSQKRDRHRLCYKGELPPCLSLKTPGRVSWQKWHSMGDSSEGRGCVNEGFASLGMSPHSVPSLVQLLSGSLKTLTEQNPRKGSPCPPLFFFHCPFLRLTVLIDTECLAKIFSKYTWKLDTF